MFKSPFEAGLGFPESRNINGKSAVRRKGRICPDMPAKNMVLPLSWSKGNVFIPMELPGGIVPFLVF